MSKLFRGMDLEKFIILIAIVLIPVGLWWVNATTEEIRLCNTAIANATRRGGLLEEIGAQQRKIEIVVQNQRAMKESVTDAPRYFQGQINAASSGRLKNSDYNPLPPKAESSTLGKQAIIDHVVDVQWPNREQSVQMDFVYAVLFNCESGASLAGGAASQSIWKLRELDIVNATDEKLLGSYKTPPAELQDKWAIKKMAFVRREPAKKDK